MPLARASLDAASRVDAAARARRARSTRRRAPPPRGLFGFGDATKTTTTKTTTKKSTTTILGDAASSVDVKDAYEFGDRARARAIRRGARGDG